jgi:hypothetical protein
MRARDFMELIQPPPAPPPPTSIRDLFAKVRR